MGQALDKDNTFRIAIIEGLHKCGINFSDVPLYKDLNFGLIIKPLNLEYNFREPIRMFFHGYPFHVGVIMNSKVYSFCPDLKNPHKGNLIENIIVESVNDWSDGEIFWFRNIGNEYLEITARLKDMLKIVQGSLNLEEYNRRHGTSLKMYYNLLSNNCTDVALSILLGQTRCFQIESIAEIVKKLSNIKELLDLLPDYVKMWIQDFKY
jgi:hypothetical protein